MFPQERGGEKKKPKQTPEGEVSKTDLKNVSLFWITFNTVKSRRPPPIPSQQGWESGEVSWGCQEPKTQGNPRK